MNSNQTGLTKNISLIRFSIFGVGGFTTIRAENASALKRMRSATNQIDRDIKDQMRKVERMDEDVRQGLGSKLERAMAALKKLSDEAILYNDTSPWQIEEEVRTMSTEEFFLNADKVFEGNTERFLNELETIEANIATFVSNKKAVGREVAVEVKDLIPHLTELTGSIFGEAPFHAIISIDGVQMLETETIEDACRKLCHIHLSANKSFLLTDYIRLEQKDRVRARIKTIDAQIDSLSALKVRDLGPLYSAKLITTMPKLKKDHTVYKAVKLLEAESSERIFDYVVSLVSGPGCLPDNVFQ